MSDVPCSPAPASRRLSGPVAGRAEAGSPNRAWLLSPWHRWGEVAVAGGAGLWLSAAFAPLEWAGAAWLALVPLLLLPVSPSWRRRWWLGYAFGLSHFLSCLPWLIEVSAGAWLGLAVVCGLFPMLWYGLYTTTGLGGGAGGAAGRQPGWRVAGESLLLAALWVATEWVRSWLLTGFPWDLLGVSQWERPALLPLTTVTGVYGISFQIVVVNLAVAACVRYLWQRRVATPREACRRPLVPVVLAVACFVPGVWLSVAAPAPGGPGQKHLRVLVVQGCIAQCRQWSQAQLDEAVEVYTSLTRQGVLAGRPDLVVWPETAVPAPVLWHRQTGEAVAALVRDVATPILLGTVDYRPVPEPGAEPVGVNSALLLSSEGRILESYDKIHLVPFGEYTPLEWLWPWLTDWIGMGRSLEPGSEYTVFRFPGDVTAGVNICYEDVFPAISREFVRRGAGLLLTLTNDAWYAESGGSRQHFAHAVFRAVENRRPLLRCGNNSDTCLVLPDGQVTGALVDPTTGNRFVRAFRVYDVPVWTDLGLTVYARHGDVFAHACAVVALLYVGTQLWAWCERKRRLLARVAPAAAAAPPPD